MAAPLLQSLSLRVAVLGGGASGLLAALHLRQRLTPADEIVILEPAAQLGAGIAYGTDADEHVLNVRAAGMSAYPGDPGHFAHWLHRAAGLSPEAFAPRWLYRRYLQESLAAAGSGAAKVEHLRRRADGVRPTARGWRVTAEGRALEVDVVVLATGHRPGPLPYPLRRFAEHPALARAWQKDPLSGLDPGGRVLLVGTGLTAVDVLASLERMGFHGEVVAVSRRGRLPAVHPQPPLAPVAYAFHRLPATPRDLLRFLREEATLDALPAVVDGLRPHLTRLWQRWSPSERQQFLRHLQPRWEVVRHRMSPTSGALIDRWRHDGRLRILAGGVAAVRNGGTRLHAQTAEGWGVFDRIIDATGPDPRRGFGACPVVDWLVHEGYAEFDPLEMGLMADGTGRLGERPGLYALGPILKGCRWETTAIPEIRAQAAALALAATESAVAAGQGI